MKLNICHLFGAILVIALSLLYISCSKNELLPNQSIGTLKLDVSLSITESDAENTLKSVAIENFKVEIFMSDVTEPLLTFNSASEMPESLELPIGEYYATAFSGSNPTAAFESPFQYGKSDNFAITAGETSQVQIICSLANIMVSVIYSDQVINSFTDYNTVIANTNGNLIFVKDENRKGYFNSGPLAIEAKLDYLSGETSNTKTLTGEIINPQVGKHYEIQVDTNSPEGSTSISIQVNNEVEKEIITLSGDDSLEDTDEGEISFGDLLITEIMYNPDALSDSDGEWFEVFNNSDNTINLKDLVIRLGSDNDLHQITADLNLPAGKYAVLERDETASENEDYVYSGITLPNSGGEEIIINTYGTDGTDGIVICSVDYGAEGFSTSLAGKSIQLNPDIKDAIEARLGSNWCSSTAIYTTGDLGTPGATNSSCN